VPSFRTSCVRRARRSEVALGAVLAVMLIGLSVLISRFHLQPVQGVTVLAQLADASLGHNGAFHVIQFATMILPALSANTSLGDEVSAVTVCYPEPEPEDRAALYALERAWAEWAPGVPLVRLSATETSRA
jgi:hypothetical protein